jgi:hypothetical protein
MQMFTEHQGLLEDKYVGTTKLLVKNDGKI